MKKNRRHWANWFKHTCVLFGIKLLQVTVQIDFNVYNDMYGNAFCYIDNRYFTPSHCCGCKKDKQQMISNFIMKSVYIWPDVL